MASFAHFIHYISGSTQHYIRVTQSHIFGYGRSLISNLKYLIIDGSGSGLELDNLSDSLPYVSEYTDIFTNGPNQNVLITPHTFMFWIKYNSLTASSIQNIIYSSYIGKSDSNSIGGKSVTIWYDNPYYPCRITLKEGTSSTDESYSWGTDPSGYPMDLTQNLKLDSDGYYDKDVLTTLLRNATTNGPTFSTFDYNKITATFSGTLSLSTTAVTRLYNYWTDNQWLLGINGMGSSCELSGTATYTVRFVNTSEQSTLSSNNITITITSATYQSATWSGRSLLLTLNTASTYNGAAFTSLIQGASGSPITTTNWVTYVQRTSSYQTNSSVNLAGMNLDTNPVVVEMGSGIQYNINAVIPYMTINSDVWTQIALRINPMPNDPLEREQVEVYRNAEYVCKFLSTNSGRYGPISKILFRIGYSNINFSLDNLLIGPDIGTYSGIVDDVIKKHYNVGNPEIIYDDPGEDYYQDAWIYYEFEDFTEGYKTNNKLTGTVTNFNMVYKMGATQSSY